LPLLFVGTLDSFNHYLPLLSLGSITLASVNHYLHCLCYQTLTLYFLPFFPYLPFLTFPYLSLPFLTFPYQGLSGDAQQQQESENAPPASL
jgi:hypothetical protein